MFTNSIKRILMFIILSLSLGFIWLNNQVNAAIIDINISTSATTNTSDSRNNDDLDTIWDSIGFFWVTNEWGQWIFYTLILIAQSLKNLFFMLATVFYLIIAIKLLVADNTEEESSKFKKGIIWITIWLMIMQIAYSFVYTLYAKQIWQALAVDLITNIIDPLIWLMEVLASIFFIAIAIFAFYRMVTANWKEEEITRAKMSIVYAIMWFVLIKMAKVIVEWVYWKINCTTTTLWWFSTWTTNCIWDAQITVLSSRIIDIINWANWFIWLITLLLIIYAWFSILFSAGDEEKVKKAKNTIIYIAIWLLLLATNYFILTFFLVPETIIGTI